MNVKIHATWKFPSHLHSVRSLELHTSLNLHLQGSWYQRNQLQNIVIQYIPLDCSIKEYVGLNLTFGLGPCTVNVMQRIKQLFHLLLNFMVHCGANINAGIFYKFQVLDLIVICDFIASIQQEMLFQKDTYKKF